MRKFLPRAPWSVVIAAAAVPTVTLLRLPFFFQRYPAENVSIAVFAVLATDIAVGYCLLRGLNLVRFGWTAWVYVWFICDRDWRVFQSPVEISSGAVGFVLQYLSPVLLFVPQANRFFSRDRRPNQSPETNALTQE